MHVEIADVVIVKNNLALLVKDRKQSTHARWDFPGSQFEKGETTEFAAHRDICEGPGVASPY